MNHIHKGNRKLVWYKKIIKSKTNMISYHIQTK